MDTTQLTRLQRKLVAVMRSKRKLSIPVCEPLLDGNEQAYVLDCLQTNWISSGGKYLEMFEEAFSASCGAQYGVACSSGTAALHLAFAALGIGSGDEVIVPCFNLIVGASSVIWTGAKPVLVDVDPSTMCLDPDRIEQEITPRTKAILAVHMYGHPCHMDPILEIARGQQLSVVEDGAQAHGAEYKHRRVGALGDVGCFSFYGNKILTTGEGGMLTTNDPAVAERVRFLRNQAFQEPRFVHRELGFNYRLTNIQAAIGLAQCEKLDEKVARKRQIAAWYTERLDGERGITLPTEAGWARNVYWMYGILLDPLFGAARRSRVRWPTRRSRPARSSIPSISSRSFSTVTVIRDSRMRTDRTRCPSVLVATACISRRHLGSQKPRWNRSLRP